MKTPKTDKILDKYNKKLKTALKESASEHSNTGKLANSIKIDYEKIDSKYHVILKMEDYGDYVDEGRKAGKGVPVSVLRKWVKSRNMVLKDSNGKDVRMTESRVNGLAYVINKKIKEEGIKPTYFIKDELDEIMGRFSKDVTNAYADDSVLFLFPKDDDTFK